MAFQLRFGASDVRVLEDEMAWQGHYAMRRLRLQYRSFGGGWVDPVTREVFERGDAVGVLPYHPESDSLVMVEQFRAGGPQSQTGALDPFLRSADHRQSRNLRRYPDRRPRRWRHPRPSADSWRRCHRQGRNHRR